MKIKVFVTKGEYLNGAGRWIVDARPSSQIERQLFTTRKEARLYASIRNRSADFNSACREYANT